MSLQYSSVANGLVMPVEEAMKASDNARQFYDRELRSTIEASCPGQFIAIEPSSRRWFIGKTFLDAAVAARKACPEHVPFVIRIGHDAAFHIGCAAQ